LTLPRPSDVSRDLLSAQFHIGGVSVQISSARSEDLAFRTSLIPFRTEREECDIDIQVEWVSGLRPMTSRQAFDSGSVWQLYERGTKLQFDFTTLSLGEEPYKRFVVDRDFRVATLQMNESAFSRVPCSADPLDYPLDELLIMHRLTQEKAIELHGAGIVRGDGVGNLFVGHSGAGKSTTTRLWTEREDVEVLSDDRIIVRRDGVAAEGKQQVPHRRFAPVRNDNKFCMRMYGTPWHGEAMYASPNSAPLTRILVLEHGHGNVLTRLSRSQAVAELFARSFVPFHRHEYVESALAFLEELADSIPVYRFAFEPDGRAVGKILSFND
jgi:hypothetical protein